MVQAAQLQKCDTNFGWPSTPLPPLPILGEGETEGSPGDCTRPGTGTRRAHGMPSRVENPGQCGLRPTFLRTGGQKAAHAAGVTTIAPGTSGSGRASDA